MFTQRMRFFRNSSSYFALAAVGCSAKIATNANCWGWISANLNDLERVERRILENSIHVPFEMTKVAHLGTVYVPCTKKRGNVKNIVLVHGFAAGNAFWASNLEALAQHFNVYAVEWIGVGRSDRPDFYHVTYEEADQFFIGAFENWRKEMKLTEFALCAHSMGAIFASSYAVQYPQHVEHLLLISPAGVPRPPSHEEIDHKLQSHYFYRAAFNAWKSGITPMSITRAAGPYGPKLVQDILNRRISFMPKSSAMRNGLLNVSDFAEYIYHNWAMKPSGEKAMMTHLAPGAHAVRPLIDMLDPDRIQMPITFLYGGESDWMDYRHGLAVVQNFKAKNRNASLSLIPFSGHLLFLDNPNAFNERVIRALLE